mgnify:CR=1 FL=1
MNTFAFRGKKAFTILELIVAMAITVVLFAIGFVGITTLRRTFELRNGYNDVALNMRSMQNNAKNVVSDEDGDIPRVYAVTFTGNGDAAYDLVYCYEDAGCDPLEASTSLERFPEIQIESECSGIGFERRTGNIVLVDPTGNIDDPTNENVCTITISHEFLSSSRNLDILVNTTNNVIDYE